MVRATFESEAVEDRATPKTLRSWLRSRKIARSTLRPLTALIACWCWCEYLLQT
jgi:hypothetical protein